MDAFCFGKTFEKEHSNLVENCARVDHKILILVPSFTAAGGISNYYQAIKGHFTITTDYFTRGARKWPYRKGHVSEMCRALKDLWMFFLLVKSGQYGLVQTTTSLSSYAMIRDGLFIMIAKIFRLKVIVFFRGWDDSFANKIESRYLPLIRWVYFKADAMIDLASINKRRLISWGYQNKIYLETTIVDEKLVQGITGESIRKKVRKRSKNMNILFLARIEKSKGIYEALETFRILKKSHSDITFTVAGEGYEQVNVREYVTRYGIPDVHIIGPVIGNQKIAAFRNSDIYLFPSYFEGMPNSVLEAMAFGLPIIARAVGGLVDFLVNGKTGYITESKDPKVLAHLTEQIINDRNLRHEMSLHNFRYAKERFMTRVVVKRVQNIYENVLST